MITIIVYLINLLLLLIYILLSYYLKSHINNLLLAKFVLFPLF